MARVTVICPTFKRHRYIPVIIEQFKNQDYDSSLMDMIILDDSPDPFVFPTEEKVELRSSVKKWFQSLCLQKLEIYLKI